ncbi:hypothetical protein MPNT_20024 [Candidatus Methylacidithermus pantelleriae]|uniref:Uncharacterized protein n=1 Tax=Candidatus Methylacidithermus pantelleriae TaxID=2744239 RepID=A0A8J2BKA5_9BACT|nr:hypothetical protein MPNT_20024 [Candidatus Methylacidithermus pantelleriae]
MGKTGLYPRASANRSDAAVGTTSAHDEPSDVACGLLIA